MTAHGERFTLSVVNDISTIDCDEWNRLAAREVYSPFLEHEFLASVEAAGCASPESGWYPRHIVLHCGKRVVGAAPAYAKTHSMGEFVFDQGLAQAIMGMEKKYYPKLVATLPFTPSPGYRFLTDPALEEAAVVRTLLDGMRLYRDQAELASHSLLFVDPDWEVFHKGLWNTGGARKDPDPVFQSWAHQYYLWENDAYADFEDYLSRFSKNQRRNICRERSSIQAQGVRVKCLTGSDLTEAIMNHMFDFYKLTNDSFGIWGAYFLNRAWFHEIGRRWNQRVVIFAAFQGDRDEPVAMSLLVRKGGQIIGRYWGASVFIRNLHFELCYYAPIDYAIREGITTFDPGMGSPHKTRRGFGSREFMSYHSFADAEIGRLTACVFAEANRGEREMIRELDESVPWKDSRGRG